MDLELDGRVAIVTGGSRGLGYAIALELAREGADVAIAARGRERLEAAATELAEATGRRVVGVPTDTGEDRSVTDMVDQVHGTFGRIDILVNNAAVPGGRPEPPVGRIGTEDLWPDLNVKVLGYLRCAQAVAPHMRAAGFGRIVNIGGLGARNSGSIVNSVRNVSVAALTKNLADKLGPDGIGVTLVHPGATRSEGAMGIITARAEAAGISVEEMERRLSDTIAIGRMVEAEELAWVVAFLCSPKAVAVCGDAVVASGGAGRSIYY